MQKTIKGVYLKSVVNRLKKELGEKTADFSKELAELEYSPFHDYPIEEHVRLNEKMATMLYGGDTARARIRVGELQGRIFAESVIGKTVFALLGNDITTVAKLSQRVFNSVTSGFTIEIDHEQPDMLHMTVKDDVYPPEFGQGVITEIVRMFGRIPHVYSKAINDHENRHTVKWE